MFDENKARDLCNQALERCGAVPAQVLLIVEDNALTRFAYNIIHQNVAETDATLILRVKQGKRTGTATSNRLDGEALDALAAHALANAKASPEDPDDPGLAEPAPYSPVNSWDENTAALSPQKRAQAVSVVCRLANEKKLNAFGAFSSGYAVVAVANSQGLYAYHARSQADFQTVMLAEDSSGHAHTSGWRVEELPVQALGEEAIRKAELGRQPRKIGPGEFTVVLDPYAVEDILSSMDFYGMGAQNVLDGSSWMNDRMGQPAMSPLVNIWDDGLDPSGVPMPFDFEGVPKKRVDVVKSGVVGRPVYDRYTAGKAGVGSTGHALPPGMRAIGPIAANLFLGPGDASLESMISDTKDGLYITRFWYTRLVHPRDCVITGMTRDGVFKIENGELAYPLKNFRFTQSYVQALAEVQAVGRETRCLSVDYGSLIFRVPALKIGRFNFTGVTK
jgi:PmbA protein